MKAIQWFPGHMAKTFRQMKAYAPQVDLILELADARLPRASRNPEIHKLFPDKPTLLVLTKIDLADPEVTQRWVDAYKRQGQLTFALNVHEPHGLKALTQACREAISDKLQRAEAKGRIGRPVRAMVVGIPNVGKSSLINRFAGRKAAKTQDRPGVTRSPQWIRLEGLELLDMPGVLWPKIVDARDQLILAASGAIRDEILSIEEVAIRAFEQLLKAYPEELANRYRLDLTTVDWHEENDLALPGAVDYRVVEQFEQAARQRGCILKGNRLDLLRFSQLFLDELRAGKIGRMSLQVPD